MPCSEEKTPRKRPVRWLGGHWPLIREEALGEDAKENQRVHKYRFGIRWLLHSMRGEEISEKILWLDTVQRSEENPDSVCWPPF
jgi:hypothetical protein